VQRFGVPTNNSSPGDQRSANGSGELRQLTVMFCDLVGSTELAQQLGDEAFFELLDGFHARTASVVERFGGHVAEYMGDGVLVYFGYPRAVERSATTAARCGLALIATTQTGLEPLRASKAPVGVRIGIHTGPVAIGRIGGATGTPRALGLTVNMAARVQAQAQPNTVVISAATQSQLKHLIVTEELGQHRLKGVAETVPLYRVLGPNAQGPQSQLPTTTFVNRTTELGALGALVTGTIEGEPGYLRIVGDPGVGKSRLLHEAKLRSDQNKVRWIELAATTLSRDSAFHPLIDYLSREWQISGLSRGGAYSDTPIAAELDAVGMNKAGTASVFEDLLGVSHAALEPESGPDVRRKLTIDALIEYFLRVAEQQPIVMVWDDVQWLDPSSREFIERLASRSQTISMIALSRPFKGDIPAEMRAWPQLVLNGLRNTHAQKMIEQETSEPIAQAVINQLLQRANGIPLFIEELLHASSPSKGDRSIPSSLQDLLMTRLDAAGEDQSIALIAAALQEQFSVDLIAALSNEDPSDIEDALCRLAANGLLQQEGDGPGKEFSFRHALLRDSAYESMTLRSRRQLHARIADLIASGDHGLPSDERLAHHQKLAAQFDQAALNFSNAGYRSKSRGAFIESQAYYEDALECFSQIGEEEITQTMRSHKLRCQLGLGASVSALHGWADQKAKQVYLQTLETARELNDRKGHVMCLTALALSSGDRGEVASAIEFAEQIGSPEQLTRLQVFLRHAAFVHPLFFSGEVTHSFEHAQQALACYSQEMDAELAELGGTYLPTMCHLYCAFGAWFLDGWQSAQQWVEKALAAVPEAREPFSHCYALAIATSIAQLDDNLEAQKHYAERTYRLAERYGFSFFLGVGAVFGAFVTAITSPSANNVAAFDEGFKLALSGDRRSGLPTHFQAAARLAQKQGDLVAAKEHLDKATRIAEETGQHYWDAELLRHKAELSALTGEHKEAQTQLEEALLIAERQGAAVLKARILRQSK